MMKNLDKKNLQLPLNSANSPATVNGINRNSPSRASIKIVLPPVVPQGITDSSIHLNNAPVQAKQGTTRQLNLAQQPYYDTNNYYNIKPSMQQIPEQSQISMFICDSSLNENERISPGSMNDQFKFNRYSSSSLDSGRGSDSIKFATGQSNRVSVHSCESIQSSTSSNKDLDNSQQSPSLSSSSSTSSSFCSSSSSSSSHTNQYSNRTLSASSSVVSHAESINNGGNAVLANNNIFVGSKNNNYANMMPIRRSIPAISDIKNNMQNLVAQAGPPSIAEMILHGISDPEIIHNWLQKINMSQYEKNFIEAAYDMATITRMTPQDLMSIGVTDPKARSVFTVEIQKLHFPESLPSYIPDSLEEWLKLLNLSCYFNSLCQQGYSTIDRVTELTWEDLEDVGIDKLGHQKKILLAIKKVKSLKSKSTNRTNSTNTSESIYGTNSSLKGNDMYSQYIPKEANSFTMPTIMQQHHQPQMPLSSINSTFSLPYQDVSIKMYANLNSPTQITPNDFCTIINPKQVPSVLFNPTSQMRTFQQMGEMNQFNPNQTFISNPPFNGVSNFQSNTPAPLRGRSLESLDTPDLSFYNTNYQYYNGNSPNPVNYKPTYQHSNGDIPSITRQTICYETNTFMNQLPNPPYEIDGTATLNRPKNLLKSRPVAKIVGNSRQSDFYDNCDSVSLKSNESSDKLSLNSECSLETASLYSTLKKKPPPPPPKRVNSIKQPNSLPSTPLHAPGQPKAPIPDQVYSNLMYLNSNYYDNNASYNENVFASCVKSLTNKFAEMHSISSDDNLPAAKFVNENVHSNNAHTLPMNKKELGLIENSPETINVSSSSSTESMPFANDNVGTIRQKASNFMQNAFKLGETKFSSSSSSSSSTSSPMYNRNLSLPNSALNSPLASVPNNSLNYSLQSKNDNYQAAPKTDTRQNVVDSSLIEIEIMLANLKTQLDSIE